MHVRHRPLDPSVERHLLFVGPALCAHRRSGHCDGPPVAIASAGKPEALVDSIAYSLVRDDPTGDFPALRRGHRRSMLSRNLDSSPSTANGLGPPLRSDVDAGELPSLIGVVGWLPESRGHQLAHPRLPSGYLERR